MEYDFEIERNFSYKDLSVDEVIKHLSFFVSRLWQIHIFGEGNTRTTAVFFIKYLRSLGCEASNDIFAENAWYFRNTLVRAYYSNFAKNIHETTEFLEVFLRNLLLKENNVLSNRIMHISGFWKKGDILNKKQDIQSQKQDIQLEKQDISNIIKKHIESLFNEFGYSNIFSRCDVVRVTNLSESRASVIISKMLTANIIIPVKGKGKGKYKFNK